MENNIFFAVYDIKNYLKNEDLENKNLDRRADEN